jgi:ribonuclease G
MKDGSIAIEVSPGETRAALIASDQRLIEFHIDRLGRQSLLDGVYLGRVRHLEPTHSGAFVEITDGVTGFLNQSKGLTQGQSIIVQVIRDAAGDKGPALTRRPVMRGRYLAITPDGSDLSFAKELGAGREKARLEELAPELAGDGYGVSIRPAAAFAENEAILDEASRLHDAWAEISDVAAAASAPALLSPPPNVIVRLLRDRATKGEIIIDDRETFRETLMVVQDFMPDLYGLVRRHESPEPIFETLGIADEVDILADRTTPIPRGGNLTIDSLEALTAIDVDRGAARGSGSREDAILTFNIAAIAEVARQIRLRNIAGLIVIDLISMKHKAKKNVLLQAAKKAFRADPNPSDVLGLTAAGLLEVTRRRTGLPLSDWLNTPAPARLDDSAEACAALRAALRESATGALTIDAPEGIISQMEGPLRPALNAVNRKLGRDLILRPDPSRTRFDLHRQ